MKRSFSIVCVGGSAGGLDAYIRLLQHLPACMVAQSWDGQIVAVIVSGYDGDGADALCCIRAVGGIGIAQKLSTARQPDMPESAIATGCIDFILEPEDIAAHIIRIVRGEPPVR